MRSHTPVGRAGRKNFNKGEAFSVDLVLESFFDSFLCVFNVFNVVYGNALKICGTVEFAEKFANADREMQGLPTPLS